MIILSIETSCDDTAISIMEAKGGITNARPNDRSVGRASFKVLANSTNSQIKIHIPFGGVFPMMAKKEHIKNLPILLEKAFKKAFSRTRKKGASTLSAIAESVDVENPIDLIAVTYGPGLEPALWTGITFAQELAKKWKVPIIPVNHMEGHVLSVFGKNKGKFTVEKIKTPALALLVSGGHTQLVLMKKPDRPNSPRQNDKVGLGSGGWMNYEIIGESLDDAVGEAFDKVARMLDLPYPGGPHISKLAIEARQKEISPNFSLPRPMLHSKNFNFSFSGLKTAVLYLIKKINTKGKLNKKTKMEIAFEFENAAIECLTHKTSKAIEQYNVKTVVVAGGVAANKHLKSEMRKITGRAKGRASKKIKLLFPTKELAGDNSLMIGIAGYLNYIKNKKKVIKPSNIKATGNLRL